jgi:hypothetical protein
VVSEEDAEHCVIVCIRGPLVDILVLIAPDVYGPYVSTNKIGQKILIVECLNAVYGTMVAAMLYYKKFVKSLTKIGVQTQPIQWVHSPQNCEWKANHNLVPP